MVMAILIIIVTMVVIMATENNNGNYDNYDIDNNKINNNKYDKHEAIFSNAHAQHYFNILKHLHKCVTLLYEVKYIRHGADIE